MPNFRMSGQSRDDIIHGATHYTQRVEVYAMAAFPLKEEHVQDGVMPPAISAQMRALQVDHKIKTIETHHRTCLYLSRANFPGLKRGLAVRLTLPKAIYVPYGTYHMSYHDGEPSAREAIRFDPGLLEPELREKLTTWGNHAVRQHRLVKIAVHTVREIVNNYAPTTAHLRAIWPFLGTLVEDKHWREKFNVPTRSLASYTPNPAVVQKYRKRIEVAELVIAQGQLLKAYEAKDDALGVQLEWWEQLAGDERY